MSRVLSYLDAPLWRLVRDLYLADKVVEALREAERLGGQDSNDLYAEAEVRAKGSLVRLNRWLEFEAIESEAGHQFAHIQQSVLNECEDICQRFHWSPTFGALVALLPHDVEAPWMPGRWGYFVPKAPYGKICVPHHLVHDPVTLQKTIRHEFMHFVSWNLTDGHCPRWLGEALSTYAEDRLDPHAWLAVQQNRAAWLNLADLEATVSSDNREQTMQVKISFGYAECNMIARYLASKEGGEGKIGQLLKEIGNESLFKNLENDLLHRSRTDSALRKIYGLSEAELIVGAENWIRATELPRA